MCKEEEVYCCGDDKRTESGLWTDFTSHECATSHEPGGGPFSKTWTQERAVTCHRIASYPPRETQGEERERNFLFKYPLTPIPFKTVRAYSRYPVTSLDMEK